MTEARIHDLGYRSYAGPRAGLGWAMVGLGAHTIERVLGLKRAFRHKIMPALVILIAFVPALIFVGMAALLPTSLIEEEILPSYGEYYLGFTNQAVLLFTAFVAPEALCTDRRTGMLALYLASPLDRTTYVLSKLAAIAVVLLTITLLPELFLLFSYTLEGAGPDGFFDFFETFGRIGLSGLLLALFYASIGATIASLTPRRGIASAAIVVVLLVTLMVSGILLENTDIADEFGLLTLMLLPIRAAWFLLGESTSSGDRGLERVDGLLTLAVTVGYVAVFGAITWWRYQRIEVDR